MRLAWRVGPILALCLLFACGDSDFLGAPGTESDAGVAPVYDAGILPDAGMSLDAGPQPPEEDGLPADDRSLSFADSLGGSSDPTCYDGFDTDGDGVTDCADTRCQAERSCCVGSTNCCSVTTPEELREVIDFTECEGLALSACYPAILSPFGRPQPWVSNGTFAPGGDANGESGATIGGEVNLLSNRVEVEAIFKAPSDCGRTCLESVGVGLFTDSSPESAASRPSATLLLSGSAQEIRLLIEDEIVASWPLSMESLEERWRLIARPDGTLAVTRDGAAMISGVRYPTSPRAWVALHGRNRNPGDPSLETAAIASLSLEEFSCDMPDSWTSGPSLAVLRTAPESSYPRAPSIAAAPDTLSQDLLGIEDDGAIKLYADTPDGWELRPDLILRGDYPFNSQGLADPALIWTESGLHVYHTAIGVDGTKSIGLAVQDESTGELRVLDYSLITSTTAPEFSNIESPSVVRHSSGTWVMVARGTYRSAPSHTFAIFTSPDGLVWSLLDRPVSEGLPIVDETSSQNTSLRDPDLIVRAGVWYLHAARRVGARWHIEAWVSDQLVLWRPLGTVLNHRAGQATRLGVRHPAALVRGENLELWATGFQSGRTFIVRTQRHAAENGLFL